MNPTGAATAPARHTFLIASLIVAALAFGYRFTSLTGFSNDHFVHLARAQAMLAGDLPIRDYTEEGVPLTVLLSAAAQLVFGQSLFAEALLMVTSLAVAAGVTCWLTARVTGSLPLGVSAAMLQVLIYPRSYSHPKMLLYSVFLLIAWWYINAPSRRRLVVVALWTAVAFLVRHDHGVYIGLGSAALIAVTHWRDGATRVVRQGLEYGVVTLLWLTPYLGYVQYQEGLVDYFRTGLAISGSEASRTRFGRLTLDPFPDGGWLAWQPVEPSTYPGIRVRWKEDVDEARRGALERELGLLAPEFAENRTWKYRVEPPGSETLSRLLARSEVEDTSGFDRGSLTLDEDPGFMARLVAATSLDRLMAGPRLGWFFRPHNVAVVLFFAIWSLPFVAMLMVFTARRPAIARPSPTFTIVLSLLVIVCSAGLLRDSLAQRIPDLYGSLPMLAACAGAIAWQMRPQARRGQIAASGLIVALSCGFGLGTLVLGEVPSRLSQAGVTEGPGTVWGRAQIVFRDTRDWPWSRQWPAGNAWKLARYVHDCTNPDDRLLVTFFSPEMNVFSRRAFAGGETSLMPVFRPPARYEASVVDRLSRQPVPIVLIDPMAMETFKGWYPAVSAYLDSRYDKVGRFSPDDRPIDIYADRRRTRTGTDAEFGWPCFANQERRTKD